MRIAQTIDVENVLIWAYRDECVAYGDQDALEPSAVANPIYYMGALGTLIDGGGRRSGGLPEDALTVEAAVSRLKGYQRRLVTMHATAGTRPDVRRVPAQAFMCDVYGSPTGKPRHIFAPMDKAKTRPVGCHVGFWGDSLESLRLRWNNYLEWWFALQAIDAALRTGRTRLKTWDLAEFRVPQFPWEDDPTIPRWLWRQVYLTWEKNVDTVPLTVRTAHNTGR
jgi:hypothetical protein